MANNQNTRVLKMVESGLLIAIGIILDTFFKFEAPWAYGGSITLCSMLPLVLISYKYGVKWGCLAGLAHGLITMMISGGRAGGLAAMIEENGGLKLFLLIMLFDYILAFSIIGLSGLAKKWAKTLSGALIGGSILGLFGRFLMHIISGCLFFGEWAEWFFTDMVTAQWGQTILNTFSGKALSFVYSVVYNGLYMIPEMILTAVAAGIIGKLMYRQLSGTEAK